MMIGSWMVWKEVIESLDSIIDDYERVNHLISMNQDDAVRIKGLESVSPITGITLELGSGPGNYSRMIHERTEFSLVCLDFSGAMHRKARERNQGLEHHYIRGVFESLPVRDEVFGFVTSAFALRDSLDKNASFGEAHRVLHTDGSFLIVDIGKPDNFILRFGMRAYMWTLVPLIGAFAGGKRPDNPWRILYDTFIVLPTNQSLLRMIDKLFGTPKLHEYMLGGLITLVATKGGG